MKKVLVIGATSAIAQECARLWSIRGDEVFLVARNAQKLASVKKKLQLESSAVVNCFCTDVNDIHGHQALLDRVLRTIGDVDVVLIAHGTLPDQVLCERSVGF